LLNLFDECGSNEDKFYIYKNLSDTAKILKNDELYTSFAEKALVLNPGDSSLRFELTLKYVRISENALSIYHHKVLLKDEVSEWSLNNIGVAYDGLEMDAKAIKFYKKSAEKGNTLAMINLAKKFMGGGFIEESEQQLEKAMSQDSYEEENLGVAMSRKERILNDEKEKEEEVLESIKNERDFKIKFAQAYSEPFSGEYSPLQGLWNSKHGDIKIELQSGNHLYGEIEKDVLAINPSRAFGLLAGAVEKKYIKQRIIFEGDIEKNLVIKHNIRILHEPGSLSHGEDSYSGTGVISHDFTKILVNEKDKDSKITIYSLAKSS